jgi:hypothetical protein
MIDSNDIKLLIDWLKIREQQGYAFPRDPDGFMITAVKSALLDRMLSGKAPFEIPPPKSHSYPWYELIERGEAEPLEVFRTEEIEKEIFGDCLIINQTPWVILREDGPEDWIVTYSYGPHLEKTQAAGEWRVNKQENGNWLIKKIT